MKRVDQLFSLLKVLFTRKHALLSLVTSIALFLSACNNIHSAARNVASTGGTANDISVNNDAGNFVLSQLVPDAVTPASVIDLIGQNGEFDTYCGTGGVGTCMCEFTFTTNGGSGSTTTSVANTYQESNMLRCPNIVPSGTTGFSVRITVVATSTASSSGTTTSAGTTYASNSLSESLSNGTFTSTSYIDLTNAATYVPVQRFQCRKREFIANPMNQTMIDPFQSQNPAIIYPFNYYTTNLASSLLNQQIATDTSWECTLTATQDHSVQWWANPNVFSRATCTSSFCSGDGDLIYPQNALTSGKIPVNNPLANGKRRSSFYLSSKAYSVFGVPVQAAVSPKDYVSATYSIIGYAAKPIATNGGTSACPNITLPANATWVKLWNFRVTDIAAARKVTGSQSITNSTISCDTIHPGDGVTVGTEIFPSCEMQTDTATHGAVFGVPLSSITDFHGIASRIALLSGSAGNASACYNFSPANVTSQIPWHYNAGASSANYGGADVWIPSPYKLDNTVPVSTFVGYPWNMYTAAASWSVDTQGAAPPQNQWFQIAGSFALPSATPVDFQTQLAPPVTLSTAGSYTDQIFVVTDPNVSDSSMLSDGSDVQQYFPRTFRQASDCVGPASCDPIVTGKTDTNWGLNTKAVGADNTTPDTYPLCVLQFYD